MKVPSEGQSLKLEVKINKNLAHVMPEAQRRHGLCAHLWIEWFGFDPWPGTSSCLPGQDT